MSILHCLVKSVENALKTLKMHFENNRRFSKINY